MGKPIRRRLLKDAEWGRHRGLRGVTDPGVGTNATSETFRGDVLMSTHVELRLPMAEISDLAVEGAALDIGTSHAVAELGGHGATAQASLAPTSTRP